MHQHVQMWVGKCIPDMKTVSKLSRKPKKNDRYCLKTPKKLNRHKQLDNGTK